jgi:hypothetical protein
MKMEAAITSQTSVSTKIDGVVSHKTIKHRDIAVGSSTFPTERIAHGSSPTWEKSLPN